jgi:hypothetical protein
MRLLYGESEYGTLPYADVVAILEVLRALTSIMALFFATDKFQVFVSPADAKEMTFLAARKGAN